MFQVFILQAALAAIFPIGRLVVLVGQPFFFTALRMLIGGSLLLSYLYFFTSVTWRQLGRMSVMWSLILLGFYNVFLTNCAEMWGLQFVPAAKSAFIYSIQPFMTAILSYFFFKEVMTMKKWLGMAIGLVGFSLMVFYDAPAETVTTSLFYISWGEFALVVAAFGSAYGWIIMRKMIKDTGASSLQANGLSMLIGSGFSLLLSLLFESWHPVPVSKGEPFLFYTGLSTITSNLVGYPLYGALLHRYTATFLSFVGFMQPLIAAFYGWLFLGEIVTWRFFVACAIVFTGLYLFYIEELRQGYIAPTQKPAVE